MWIFWGHQSKTERLKQGREIDHYCSICDAITHFTETRATKAIEVYFVPIEYDEEQLMVCSGCGSQYRFKGEEKSLEQNQSGDLYQQFKTWIGEKVDSLIDKTPASSSVGVQRKSNQEDRSSKFNKERLAKEVEERLAALKRKLKQNF